MTKLTANDPHIHPDCEISNSTFGAYCEVGRGSRILNSEFGDYAYCDRYADIANCTVGKFANIAAFTRIGPTDHPMANAAQHHFLYRSADYWDDAANDAAFFGHRASRRCVLGHDCWIGHGAIIMPEVTLGIGAIAAAGAVVTRDVPPFMIVDGHPSKPRKVNVVGLERNGYSPEAIASLKAAFRLVFRSRQPRVEILAGMREEQTLSPEVEELLNFLSNSERGNHGRFRNV